MLDTKFSGYSDGVQYLNTGPSEHWVSPNDENMGKVGIQIPFVDFNGTLNAKNTNVSTQVTNENCREQCNVIYQKLYYINAIVPVFQFYATELSTNYWEVVSN